MLNTNQIEALESAGRELFGDQAACKRYLTSLQSGMGAEAVRVVEDTLDVLQADLDDMISAAELASERASERWWEERGRTAGVTEPPRHLQDQREAH